MNTFLQRVSLTNYKSIVRCDVTLRPLTVVVGRNGSGKSNFIDSLHFIADALQTTLEYAIRKRGGNRSLIHRREQQLSIDLTFRIGDDKARYLLTLRHGRVEHENLLIDKEGGEFIAGYNRHRTQLTVQIGDAVPQIVPSVLQDRLTLVALSGDKAFREAFDALTAMRFHRLDPDSMRELHEPDPGEVLTSNGSNISSVWGRLEKTNPEMARRLTSYLAVIVPEINRIQHVTLGPHETLRFHQGTEAFDTFSMSDGTLRALGAMVASRQGNGSPPLTTLIAIEEPETALHPGAVAALMDALHEASTKTQIIVSSHSPDVLDHVDIQNDTLLVTEFRQGATVVAEVDEASRQAIRRHLYTPGDLLRMDQLQPATPRAE